MNLFTLSNKFNTQKRCLKYLEKLRWNNNPVCPNCPKSTITKVKRNNQWHCNKCNGNFSVMVGTIFEHSAMPLPKWFVLINLMMNAKQGVSAKQIERNVGIDYRTAWYACMRVRCAMADQAENLHGTIEMDEAYFSGSPARSHKAADNAPALSDVKLPEKSKRGRGTSKVAVVGAVERGGRVTTKMVSRLNSETLMAVLKRYIKEDKSTTVITDGWKGYNKFSRKVHHEVIKHKKEGFVRGKVHVNTIEGFWSIVKNGIKGNYHAISKKYLPFYLAEYAYKYNHRKSKNDFELFLKNAVCHQKCMVNLKPKKEVKKIAYRKSTKKTC